MGRQTTSALIAFGSNLGNRQDFINQALAMIHQRVGKISAISGIYETLPMGAADQSFLNGAAVIETMLEAEACLSELLGIEKDLGRERTVKWGNRTIDLDILLWNQHSPATIDSAMLSIPHPHMLERDFVLFPANDIAAHWLHPISGNSLSWHKTRLRSDFAETAKMLVLPDHFPDYAVPDAAVPAAFLPASHSDHPAP